MLEGGDYCTKCVGPRLATISCAGSGQKETSDLVLCIRNKNQTKGATLFGEEHIQSS